MQSRSRLRVALLAISIASVAFAGPALAETGTPSQSALGALTRAIEAEQYLFDQLNAARVSNGLAALVRDPLLDQIAIEWTDTMFPTGHISHRGDLAEQVQLRITTQWKRIGENVGWGPSAEWLHDGFWNSTPHRSNMLGEYNRIGIGARLESDGDVWVTVNFLDGPDLAPLPVENEPQIELPPVDSWAVTPQGLVTGFGGAPWLGDVSDLALKAPIVGITATRSGNGYWLVATDGGIFSLGDATYLGSMGAIALNSPIVGMAATPSGKGYWLVATDGGVFSFGDAGFHGSTGAIALNSPIVGVAATPSGKGYWLVAADGGVFSFGDAAFHGSAGALKLASPVTAIAATQSGSGYWLVAGDGGVFTYGDARFSGSAAGSSLDGPVIGMAPGSPDSEIDYWIYSGTGRARGYGSVNSTPTDVVDPTGRIAGVTVRPEA